MWQWGWKFCWCVSSASMFKFHSIHWQVLPCWIILFCSGIWKLWNGSLVWLRSEIKLKEASKFTVLVVVRSRVKRTSRAAGHSSFAGHKKKRKVLGWDLKPRLGTLDHLTRYLEPNKAWRPFQVCQWYSLIGLQLVLDTMVSRLSGCGSLKRHAG